MLGGEGDGKGGSGEDGSEGAVGWVACAVAAEAAAEKHRAAAWTAVTLLAAGVTASVAVRAAVRAGGGKGIGGLGSSEGGGGLSCGEGGGGESSGACCGGEGGGEAGSRLGDGDGGGGESGGGEGGRRRRLPPPCPADDGGARARLPLRDTTLPWLGPVRQFACSETAQHSVQCHPHVPGGANWLPSGWATQGHDWSPTGTREITRPDAYSAYVCPGSRRLRIG